MAEHQPIETYGRAPHNRLCHAWPILLSVLQRPFIPLLAHLSLALSPVYQACFRVHSLGLSFFQSSFTEHKSLLLPPIVVDILGSFIQRLCIFRHAIFDLFGSDVSERLLGCLCMISMTSMHVIGSFLHK